jgi:hypothetical protein
MRVAALALFLSFTLPLAAESGPSVSLTLVPAGVVRWRGEGKILPQGYTNRTENQDAPLYVLEWRQAPADRGYWGLSLWHTGVFGGGEFARESLPDVRPGTGGALPAQPPERRVHEFFRHPLPPRGGRAAHGGVQPVRGPGNFQTQGV